MHAPVTFPKDEAPHADLTEWWYYTGHLEAADGRRWGFELVTFQILRATLEPFYIAHFAITDQQRGQFHYEDTRQSRRAGAAARRGSRWTSAAGRCAGSAATTRFRPPWPDYRLDLALTTSRPPVLHEGGLVTFGAAGDSYYYSRTGWPLSGTIDDHGEQVPVTGLAWFDKQWGNFLVMGGGWDWFSLQLDDGSDVMLNLIRDLNGETSIAYGTYVAPDGSFRHLRRRPVRGSRRSASGPARTPASPTRAAGDATVRDPGLDLRSLPVMQDQELDTRQSTSLVYWEGAQTVDGTLGGQPISGQGYVELVGYGSADACAIWLPRSVALGRR